MCAIRVRITRLLLALGLRRSQHVCAIKGTMARQEGHALHVLITRLLLAPGLQQCLHVRAMRGTVVTLVQEGLVLLVLKPRIRQVLGTTRALNVLITRLLLAPGLRHSLHVSAMRGTTATLVRQEGNALNVLLTRLLLALGLRHSLHVRAV